jgi:hypothetical protein
VDEAMAKVTKRLTDAPLFPFTGAVGGAVVER